MLGNAFQIIAVEVIDLVPMDQQKSEKVTKSLFLKHQTCE